MRSKVMVGIIEEMMQEHGDLFLKVFHKHNFTYSTHVDWQTLLSQIESAGDQESQDLLTLINE